MRAVVVTRLSRMTDATTSPESQRANGIAEATALGADVVGFAEDPDVSATRYSPLERPELGDWLRRPEDFEALIFRSVDRVSRNVSDFVWLLDWADKGGVRLVCMSPRLDFSEPMGRAMAILLATFAEMESRQTGERIRGARVYMRGIARWPAGRVPYGYRRTDHPSGTGYTLEHDPEEAPRLRDAVSRYQAGESLLAICRSWNQAGVRSAEAVLRERADKPRGETKWHARSLDLIFRSLSMRGVVHHQGKIQRDDDGMPLRYCSGILTDAEHISLLAEMDRRGNGPRERKDRAAPLLGIVRCARCRSRLYRNSSDGSGTYRCASRYRGLTDCDGTSVKEVAAQEYIEERFLAYLGDWPVTIQEEIQGEDHSDEIAEVESALSDLEADRYERSLFKTERGLARYAAMHAKLSDRLERLAALPSTKGGVSERETGETYRDLWARATAEERRETLLRLGATVWVTGRKEDGPPEQRMKFEFSEE